MNRIYISDIIPDEEISKWRNGDRVLITAQTGSGKSEFIKNKLYQYCYKNDKSILLLSNRDILKNQNINELEDKINVVTPLNYQNFETRILNGQSVEILFKKYDFIVYDEVHYIFSDSAFNDNTDLLIDPLINTPTDKIFIFITATPQILLDYQPEYNYEYSIPHDYSYIKKIYFFNKSNIPEQIFQRLPANEKAIYFCSDAFDAWEMSTKFSESSFICSESNALSRKSDKSAIKQIVENSKFSSKILCTTKVLDNGVNIKDPTVKHIIIDMLDPISFIQCLGRKRSLSEDDTISLYVKNYHGGYIFEPLRSIRKKLAELKEFEVLDKKDFIAKYGWKDYNEIADNKFNQAKYLSNKYEEKYLGQMLGDTDKMGYKKFICRIINFSILNVYDGDKEYEKISITKFLENILNKKIFKEEQENFKITFFESIFSPKITNYRHRGLETINSILREDNLPFYVESRKEKSRGINRDKRYWIVRCIDSGDVLDI